MTTAGWDEYDYRVVSCEMVTPVIAQLWLEPTGIALPFTAGQYVLLSDTAFRVPQRSYSVANAPRPDGKISILVTLVAEGVTSIWASHLKRYDEVLLEGPFGTFTTSPAQSGPILLLGAGSGLAPNRALAEQALADGAPRPVTLVFSGRTTEHVIDHAVFDTWATEHPGFTYHATLTRDPAAGHHIRVPALLPNLFDSLNGYEVFAAGPSGFVTGCERAASELGAQVIHTEEFFVDPQPWSVDMPAVPGQARNPG